MNHSSKVAVCLSLLIPLLALPTIYISNSAATAEEFKLEAGEQLSWFKGNMHTHSHWSDGDDYLEMIALWYREHDYNFLVFTDHNVLANSDRWVTVKNTAGGPLAYGKLKIQFPGLVEERISENGDLEVRLRRFDEVAKQFNAPGSYLLIQGEEISDRFEERPFISTYLML